METFPTGAPVPASPVRLGVAGWLWPGWREVFYPADMPEEWRLAYFNTQFSCVWLAAETWRAAGAETRRDWGDDTRAGFVFLLEGESGSAPPHELEGRAEVMTADDPRILWFDASTELRGLSQRLTQAERRAEILLSRDGELAQIERVRTLLNLLGLPCD